ncbi:MAG TPA: OadG family transporter subunit [Dissulfurispiraceae bacterium]|nr:OadG family transporter subunit [Dissulfurispiraceae bacterium]
MNWLQDFIQAAVIMILGMGVTFAFLGTLIFAIHLTAKIVAKYAPAPKPLPAAPAAVAASVRDEGAIVAAITMAAKKYHADRKDKKQ